jgi:hypothetical protein
MNTTTPETAFALTSRSSGAGRRIRRAGTGYAYLHHAVEDHTRPAYSEILDDEKKEPAAAFWIRVAAFFAAHGITFKAALRGSW